MRMLRNGWMYARDGSNEMYIKGFKFGFLLQFAVGPVCIYVINTAIKGGILPALYASLGATVVDILFVSLAIIGVGKLLADPKIKVLLKWFGAIVLIYFGAGIILGSFGISIIPGLGVSTDSISSKNAFLTSAVLTISSPLSIVFWSGVFAAKLADENYTMRDMKLFGAGAVTTTMFFLSVVSIVFGLVKAMISPLVIEALNVAVGVILILFAGKIIYKKNN